METPNRVSIFFLISVLVHFVNAHSQQNKDEARTKESNISLYLTFDDGPYQASRHLLSLTRQDSIPITVFIIGEHVFSSKEMRLIYHSYLSDSLIETGNHSYSHAHKKFKSYYRHPQQVVADIIRNSNSLNLENQTARLPGRNAWRAGSKKRDDLEDVTPAADSLANLGYTIIGWDLVWIYDSTGRSIHTSDQMISAVRQLIDRNTSFTPGHIVILCHDPMLENEYSRLQLRLFINKIKTETGWKFKRLSEYPVDSLKW